MASLTIILSSQGDSLTCRTGEIASIDGLERELHRLVEEAPTCKTHDAVFDFMNKNRDILSGSAVTLLHSDIKEYRAHDSGDGEHGCDFDHMRAFVEQRRYDVNPDHKLSILTLWDRIFCDLEEESLLGLISEKPLEEDAELLMDHAKVHVNFWGARVVTFGDVYKGSVTLDRLANALGQKAGVELSVMQRVAGLDSVKRLHTLYAQSDDQLKVSNFFTRFINWLREYTHVPTQTPYFSVESGEMSMKFRAYHREEYQKLFGDPVTAPKYFGSYGVESYCASDSALRAKLVSCRD